MRLASEPRSLFGEILDWMLAPLLLLWPMSLAITWLVAQTIANRPYDRDLAERAQALARETVARAAPARRAAGASRSDFERAARALMPSDDDDLIFFQVLGPRGELLAGDSRLSGPGDDIVPSGTVRLRDDSVGEERVRVAYVWLIAPSTDNADVPAGEGLVQVAETLGKRSRLATEIVKGVILPQFIILPVAVVLVWFALSRGIRPLADLQQHIRRRESTDLSPIAEGNVPEEVVPLVRAINDLLQRLDRSIASQRHFLADAAHQLKTPLAGLRTQAELAAREIDSGRGEPEAMKHSLRQIAVSSQRAAHMVDQLLSMARAEDTGTQIRRQPIDLAAVTREVVHDFVPRALERRIDLGYEGPLPAPAASAPDHSHAADQPATAFASTTGRPDGSNHQQTTARTTSHTTSHTTGDTPARPTGPATSSLLGDPVLVGELVRNLIDNALQYTPPGGTVTARVLPDPFGHVVVLQVEDTGPGIAPGERELVFQPFYRALGTQVDGSGLGLAIVQEVAQRHGAQINVDDARPRRRTAGAGDGPGARFTVRFPLSQPPFTPQGTV